MLVYCLLGRVDYEGDSLLGVYPSDEAAREARASYVDGYYDRYYVQVRELGAQAGAEYEVEGAQEYQL